MPRPTSPDDPAMDRHARDIQQLARPLDRPADLDPLLARIGHRPYVLLGEASHGTSDYYRTRADLTRRLITHHDVRFVAVEGDWPDCYRVNRWVRLLDDGPDRAVDVLDGFERWPTWMWANHEVAEFLDWLRDHNRSLPPSDRVGFYGLDVYSLWESMDAVLGYVSEHDPGSLDAVRAAFQCFEPYGEDAHDYAWATRRLSVSCEDAVVDLLRAMRPRPTEGPDDEDAFAARQNAEVAVNAERYYRAMVAGGSPSWNVRDNHMVDTLDRLMAHHGHRGQAVVWAHNTHIGDARATPMAYAGMVNVGQLVRERHGRDQAVLVGFGCHAGSVVAADGWGSAMGEVPVPPSRPGSHEDLIQGTIAGGACLFVFGPDGEQRQRFDWLTASRGHRAIGVVYDGERAGNWVPTVLGRRYDAFYFFERTTALRPIHGEPAVTPGDELETYPFNR